MLKIRQQILEEVKQSREAERENKNNSFTDINIIENESE